MVRSYVRKIKQASSNEPSMKKAILVLKTNKMGVVWVTTEAGPKFQNGQPKIYQFINFGAHKKSFNKISTH